MPIFVSRIGTREFVFSEAYSKCDAALLLDELLEVDQEDLRALQPNVFQVVFRIFRNKHGEPRLRMVECTETLRNLLEEMLSAEERQKHSA